MIATTAAIVPGLFVQVDKIARRPSVDGTHKVSCHSTVGGTCVDVHLTPERVR